MSPSIVLHSGAAIFVVRDVPGSIAHYRDVLGFRVEFTYGEPAVYAGVERGGVAIHLQSAGDTERPPGQGALYAFVTGLDALYAELKSKGARLRSEPKDYPYGMRDFDLEDLDGNRLSFGEPYERG